MKFQHLILPLVLWLLVCIYASFFTPTSPLIIGTMFVLFSFATYFSLRTITHGKLPLIVVCCISLFLLSNMLLGFNLINLLLITAMGTLITILTK